MIRIRHMLLALPLAAGLLVTAVAANEIHSVEALNQAPEELEGETVRLEGIIAQVNEDIMGRNFLRLVDGTGEPGDFITLTSQQTADPGDRVRVEGVYVLERDFGAGYVYPVLIEQARLEDAED
ncbi:MULTISPECIES: hypothetical protein [Thioalkalivibrio]|uniref:DNA-binding protein n=1 Tax=Thioalkalivibrio halophilus TaxID=252474 RepID=A0A1V2ZZT1_9GAMM|nr:MULTISPECIES: hypothetical protein [Thioalkalivibrio]OOC10591.1 hypothetical protein B1A74_04740 [Thioalkalivibrio halophilus]